MAGSMGTFRYESDDGEAYRIRMDVTNAAAAGATAEAGPTNKPGRMRPRYLLARHPTTGRERRIVITAPDNVLWLGTDNSIDLHDFGVFPSVSTTYVVLGRIGERRYG